MGCNVVETTKAPHEHGAMMEINDAKEEKAIPCHIILACDVYPFIMHLILLRTAVAL